MTYRIGDRCPDCGYHFREVGQLLPTQEEYDVMCVKKVPSGRTHIIVCPNGHEYEPHPDFKKYPFPTVVFEP